eukprot:921750-Amphidinium_carterae.1
MLGSVLGNVQLLERPQLRAAVRSGADAVYFGLDIGLNARARASNFASDDLPTVMSYLHERGGWGAA